LLLTIQEFAVYLAVDYTEIHSQRSQSMLDMRITHLDLHHHSARPSNLASFHGSENANSSMEIMTPNGLARMLEEASDFCFTITRPCQIVRGQWLLEQPRR